jgi:hypothetical protein
MFRSLTSIAFVLMTWMPSSVESHGSLLLPRSRNEVARQEGTNGEKSGVPVKEYCWQCLNRNNGVCGYVDEKDYDAWVDSTGKPMPWKPQATYQRGQVITVSTGVWAYHWGHVELRACPNGRQSTQACLDSYPLEFVEDVDYDMPKDPKYPDRGYLAERYETYTMKFRLPDNLVGDQVLLQVRIFYRIKPGFGVSSIFSHIVSIHHDYSPPSFVAKVALRDVQLVSTDTVFKLGI